MTRLIVFALVFGSSPALLRAQEISFRNDVMAVLSRSGCNQGTCHGANKGKNGFKLSLRGVDQVFDVRSFLDDLAGRRANVASPDDSLIFRSEPRDHHAQRTFSSAVRERLSDLRRAISPSRPPSFDI